MKYMLLIYEAEEIWANKSEEERRQTIADHRELTKRLSSDGLEFSGAPLMPTSTSTTLRVRNNKRDILDGPFAATKEQLAGIYIINCDSLDDAIDYAEMIPNSATGSIEIRPLADHGELTV